MKTPSEGAMRAAYALAFEEDQQGRALTFKEMAEVIDCLAVQPAVAESERMRIGLSDRCSDLALELSAAQARVKDLTAQLLLRGDVQATEASAIGARVDALLAAQDRVKELEETAERYRLTTLSQDARVAELEAALEELYETANRFPAFEGSRLASALDSASAALAHHHKTT